MDDKKYRYSLILEAGLIDYAEALALQQKIFRAKKEKRVKEDILILLEHPPTITIGKKGSSSEILASEDKLKEERISVYHIGRGGKATYHGPGQLVGYPIIDLTQQGKDLHLYLRNLEEVIIRTLRDFGILAGRKKGLTGVWVNNQKIASIGIEIKNWISLHGFALNVNCDLSHFGLIQPCGMKSTIMTSLAEVSDRQVKMEKVTACLIRHFEQIFAISLRKISLQKLQKIIG